MQLLIAEHCHEHQKTLIGGLILLTYGHTVHYAYGGWSWEHQSLRPKDALHWEAIQFACARGFKRYDLGAAPIKQGLAQYKAKWGALAEPIYGYRYFAKNDLTVGRPKSHSGTFKLPIDIHAPESMIRQFALNILGRLPSGAVSTLSKWAHQI